MFRSGHVRPHAVAVPMVVSLLAVLCFQVGSVSSAFAATTGDINAFAGNGTAGYSGDGGPASAALLNNPAAVRTDGAGNIYVSDESNNVVRRIDSLGVITTIAGNGTAGFSGDGGPATAAELSGPVGLALDATGDLFIADAGNLRIREVDPSGTIQTVAGSGGRGYATGDNGPATVATLGPVSGVAVDAAGNIYISDSYFHNIRKVDGATGTISRFAGTGLQRDRGDGGPALSAAIVNPSGMFVDSSNNLLVASGWPGDVIRKINLATGIISTVAGMVDSDGIGFVYSPPTGDGGPATSATLAWPKDVTSDSSGVLYIADAPSYTNTDHAIRVVDTTGIIRSAAGSQTAGYSGDGGPGPAALLNTPLSAAPLGHGTFVIADSLNNALRVVSGSPDLLSLGKGAPLTVPAGGAFAYQLAVHNDGTAGAASGVTLTDPLPSGVHFVGATSSQGSCSQSAGIVTCNLGAVAAASAVSVTINVTAPSLSTTLVNTASVTANEADPVTSDNSASATTFVNAADLVTTVAESSPSPGPNVGQTLVYTATVTNRGPTAATGVKVTDPLPAGLTLQSVAAQQGTCTHTATGATCLLGNLAVGAASTVTLQAKATVAGVSVNTVTATGAEVDPFPRNNSGTVRLTISGTGCGEVITKKTTVTKDIGPCAGDGVIIGADNITLNLSGHRIFGLGTGSGFGTVDGLVGIRLPARTGVTVTGGTVSGFDTGIFINSGVQNTIKNMTVRDNIGPESSVGPFYPELGDGILIEHSSSNQILSNQVIHNGTYDGIGVFGLDTNSNLFQGNTIADTVTNLAHADGEGIIINNFLAASDPRRGESISHNDVIGNTLTGNAAAGISSVSNLSALIKNNTSKGNGLTAFPSNGIGVQVGRVADPNTGDMVIGNTVSGNGEDGIQVLRPATGTTISGNTADANNALNNGSFNYDDTNGNCTANTWTNNISTHGTVSPTCLVPSAVAAPATAAPSTTKPNAGANTGPGSASTRPQPQANRPLPPPP